MFFQSLSRICKRISFFQAWTSWLFFYRMKLWRYRYGHVLHEMLSFCQYGSHKKYSHRCFSFAFWFDTDPHRWWFFNFQMNPPFSSRNYESILLCRSSGFYRIRNITFKISFVHFVDEKSSSAPGVEIYISQDNSIVSHITVATVI